MAEHEAGAGVMAEFESPEALVAAGRALVAAGYRKVESFTPYPVPELEQILRLPRSPIAKVVFGAALTGAAFAYAFQYWMIAIDYPIDVGGMPANSAPAFIPITFETSVLFGGLTAFISLFLFCRLPRLWDPVFETPGFESASINRFWLGIDARDEKYESPATAQLLRELGALQVVELEVETPRQPEPKPEPEPPATEADT